MQINTISFEAKFKTPHTNVPYPMNTKKYSCPKQLDKIQKNAVEKYIEQLEKDIEKNPNNNVSKVVLNEYKKILKNLK